MMSQTKLTATIAAATAAFALSANAAVIYPSTTQAHNLQGGGGISSLYDDNDLNAGTLMVKPDANDPSTWTAPSQGWPNDWQGNGPLSGATNSKVGWVTFDFGSVEQLDEIFIWNVSENTGQPRRVLTYNIYFTNTPTVAPVSGNGNAAASLDYDFSSGGWTKLPDGIEGIRTLDQYSPGTAADGIETLGFSAQYVGLEFITYGGDTGRVGLNEVVFTTAVPEPSSLLLIGSLGSLFLLRRRR